MGDKTITAINLGYTGSAGFTYRLYRLEPRASRSKGPPQTVVRIESMAVI